MARRKIVTTADLRERVADVMDRVQDGTLERDRAETIIKGALVICQSMYSEARILDMTRDTDRIAGRLPGEVGTLRIGNAEAIEARDVSDISPTDAAKPRAN